MGLSSQVAGGKPCHAMSQFNLVLHGGIAYFPRPSGKFLHGAPMATHGGGEPDLLPPNFVSPSIISWSAEGLRGHVPCGVFGSDIACPALRMSKVKPCAVTRRQCALRPSRCAGGRDVLHRSRNAPLRLQQRIGHLRNVRSVALRLDVEQLRGDCEAVGD